MLSIISLFSCKSVCSVELDWMTSKIHSNKSLFNTVRATANAQTFNSYFKMFQINLIPFICIIMDLTVLYLKICCINFDLMVAKICFLTPKEMTNKFSVI